MHQGCSFPCPSPLLLLCSHTLLLQHPHDFSSHDILLSVFSWCLEVQVSPQKVLPHDKCLLALWMLPAPYPFPVTPPIHILLKI